MFLFYSPLRRNILFGSFSLYDFPFGSPDRVGGSSWAFACVLSIVVVPVVVVSLSSFLFLFLYPLCPGNCVLVAVVFRRIDRRFAAWFSRRCALAWVIRRISRWCWTYYFPLLLLAPIVFRCFHMLRFDPLEILIDAPHVPNFLPRLRSRILCHVVVLFVSPPYVIVRFFAVIEFPGVISTRPKVSCFPVVSAMGSPDLVRALTEFSACAICDIMFSM